MVTYQNEHMSNPTYISRWLIQKGVSLPLCVYLIWVPAYIPSTPSQHRTAAGGSEDSGYYRNRHKQDPTVTWPTLSPALSLAFAPEQRSFIMVRSGMREWDRKGCSPACYLKYFQRKKYWAHIMKCDYFYSNIIEITQLYGFHPPTLATFSHRKDISDWIKAVIFRCNNNRTETSVDLPPVMNLSKHTQIQKLPSNLNLHGLVLFV